MVWRGVTGRHGVRMLLVLALLAAAALLAMPAAAPKASAATTAVSTVYKTGTDTAAGSTAASPDAPGGQVTGTAHPGDTINWAVSYQNNTGDNAAVNLTDPLGTAGAYVPGSLKLPPSPDGAQPLAPQYSADNGASWQPGTPPAGATGAGLTGTFPAGTKQLSANVPAPSSVVPLNAGDGYNAVSSPDGSRVYAVYHQDSTNASVFCATIAGGLCPGWPAGSNVSATYVSPVAGTPVGTGSNQMTTAWQNGTFTAGGNLYWEAQQTTAVGGLYPVGVMCLNLAALRSCGFTQLDAVPDLIATSSGLIGGTGIPAPDGSYYFADEAGKVLCFSPAAGACGTTTLPGVTAASAAVPMSATYGSYVLAQVLPAAGAANYSLYCYDTATSSLCPGFPVTGSPLIAPSSGPSGTIAPVLGPSGSLAGACVRNYAYQYGCWNLSGATVANPYPATVGGAISYTGDALADGSRVYLPYDVNSVGCYDFAGYTGTGTVPACTGFTAPQNLSNYTVRPMTGQPGCLLADGGAAKIRLFDAATGGGCQLTTVSQAVNPAGYYCGTGAAAFKAWGQLTLSGLPAGSYSGAAVSLTDASGNPVPGFTSVVLPAGTTTLDISSIPVTGATGQLTATVTLSSATAAVTTGQVSLSWQGDPPQMCFQTTAPPQACATAGTLSNTASAVTDGSASGGASDAPGGNSSGTATFTLTPGAAQCRLTLTKTASVPHAQPGDTVTYTITARNTGSGDYTAAAPAAFTDDLTSVLASAAYGNDAAATAGSVSYAAPALSWTGPLAAGATATITYSVTVNAAGSLSGQDLANTVTSNSPGSNCTAAAPSVACTATVPIDAITIVKTASPGTVHVAGDVISYSFLVTNAGSEALHGITVADTQLPPASQGGLSAVTCLATTLAPGQSTTCTAKYTVTQADMDHGRVDDTATASGSPPSGPPVTSAPSAASVTTAPAPGISIVKSASASDVAHFLAGQVITYTFVVTNTGNVTLAPVTVTDTGFSGTGSLSPVSCPPGGTGTVASLAPGAQAVCTATYTLTTADVDAGHLADTGVATGTPPTGPDVTSDSILDLPAAQNPALEVVKSAAPAQVQAAGDQVTYSFKVTNTGNVTLHGIMVDDTQLPPASQAGLSAVTCPDTTLAPGQFTTCTATYTVTQADIDDGGVDDSATASGSPLSGPPVTSPPSHASVPAAQSPGLTVAKSVPATPVTRAGQQLRYSFLVTNTGNVTMYHVKVTDTVAPPSDPASLSPVTCPQATLAPAAKETCTATYTVTQADVDHGGQVRDSATVTGVRPATAGTPTPPPLPPSPPSAATVPVAQAPGLRIVRSAATVQVTGDPAEVIRYQFTLADTGNLTLTEIGVSDPLLAAEGITVRCPRSVLAPGESETCAPARAYTVTQADIARGTVVSTADAHARTPSGHLIRSAPSTVTTTVTPLAALIPTGEGASAAAPGASPALAGAGAAALSAGMVLLLRGRRRRRA
jgi:uncharacterized repeat protein (TIGR01451 family)